MTLHNPWANYKYIYNEYKWDLHIKNRLWQANVIIYNIPSVIKFIEPER